MGETSRSRRLREALVDGLAPTDITLAGLCQRAAAVLDAAGVALQLHVDGATAVSEASGSAASRAADVQAMLGEGPTIDAEVLRLPVLASNLPVDERWPELASAAAILGLRAAVAVPMLSEVDQLGVLTAYLDRAPGDDGIVTRAAHLARVLTGVVLELPAGSGGDPRLSEAVGTAAVAQGRIHQAAGIISVDHGCGIDDALVRLRAYAYANDLLLGEVAAAVIDEGLRLR